MEWQRLGMAAAAALGRGDFRAACTALEGVVALRPHDADSWYNLGYARRQLADFAGALDAYAAAIANGLSGAEAAHVNRAAILSNHLNRMAEAAAELDQALALNPDFLPAWLNRGELHEDQGNADAARAAYARALQIAPLNGRAQARLAALSILDGDTKGAIAALEARCRTGLARDDDALDILFAHGNALDADRRYAESFARIMAANALSAALRHPSQRYDAARMEQLVDQLHGLDAGDSRDYPSTSPDRALFICGMFRSGSTVFEQVLARHPDIASGGEQEMIPAFAHGDAQPYPASLTRLDTAALNAMRQRYKAAQTAVDGTSRYVTDKRPDNFLHIGLIKRLFPAARIIITRRAPIDNLLSILFLNFAETVRYSDEIGHIVHYMQQYDRLMAHWISLYPGDIRVVDYEMLVADPAKLLAPIHDWLGLDPPDANATNNAPVIRTPSNWQARGPVHQRSVERWRNYAQPLAAHQPLLARLPSFDWQKGE